MHREWLQRIMDDGLVVSMAWRGEAGRDLTWDASTIKWKGRDARSGVTRAKETAQCQRKTSRRSQQIKKFARIFKNVSSEV